MRTKSLPSAFGNSNGQRHCDSSGSVSTKRNKNPRNQYYSQAEEDNCKISCQVAFILIANALFVVHLLKVEFLVRPDLLEVIFQYNYSTNLPSVFGDKSSFQFSSHRGEKRIAVVIAGSLQRFQLNSTVHHLLKPTLLQGHSVDYFISLATEWKTEGDSDDNDNLRYMNNVHWDPIFSNGTIVKQSPDLETVKEVTRRSIMDAGGMLQVIELVKAVDIDHDKQLKAKRAMARKNDPHEDPDARFPFRTALAGNEEDVHKKQMQAAAEVNRNTLRLMLSIHKVWDSLKEVEKDNGIQYDYVMFLRDDTLWLEDIDFNGLIKGVAVKKDAIALSCDDAAAQPTMNPTTQLNDHGIVISRSKAKTIGDYYSELFKADLDACAKKLQQPDPKQQQQQQTQQKQQQKGQQQQPSLAAGAAGGAELTSQMVFKWILEQNEIKVHKVGQRQLPFQRSFHVISPNGIQLEQCFRTYCQSKKNKLDDHGIPKCKDVKYPPHPPKSSSSTKKQQHTHTTSI